MTATTTAARHTALPATPFFTRIGWSDCYAYETLRVVSGQTIEVRELKAELDPSFKPEFVVGGFAGHCTNINQQQWVFSSDESAPIVRIRLGKDGKWKQGTVRFSPSAKPFKRHDFNF